MTLDTLDDYGHPLDERSFRMCAPYGGPRSTGTWRTHDRDHQATKDPDNCWRCRRDNNHSQ